MHMVYRVILAIGTDSIARTVSGTKKVVEEQVEWYEAVYFSFNLFLFINATTHLQNTNASF